MEESARLHSTAAICINTDQAPRAGSSLRSSGAADGYSTAYPNQPSQPTLRDEAGWQDEGALRAHLTLASTFAHNWEPAWSLCNSLNLLATPQKTLKRRTMSSGMKDKVLKPAKIYNLFPPRSGDSDPGGCTGSLAYHLEYPVVPSFQLRNTFHAASPPIVLLTELPPRGNLVQEIEAVGRSIPR